RRGCRLGRARAGLGGGGRGHQRPALIWVTTPAAGLAARARARRASSGRPTKSYALASSVQSSALPPSRARRASSAATSDSIDFAEASDFAAAPADESAAGATMAAAGRLAREWREPIA